MNRNTELKQLEFKAALLGLWQEENNTFSYFFHGEIVDIIIGGLPIGEYVYDAFINDEDDIPYIKITNEEHQGNTQIKEYKVLLIDTKNCILKLLTENNAEMVFNKRNSLL